MVSDFPHGVEGRDVPSLEEIIRQSLFPQSATAAPPGHAPSPPGNAAEPLKEIFKACREQCVAGLSWASSCRLAEHSLGAWCTTTVVMMAICLAIPLSDYASRPTPAFLLPKSRRIPLLSRKLSATVGLSRAPRASDPDKLARKLGLGTRHAAGLMLRGIALPDWQNEARRTFSGQGTLQWPVDRGRFTRGFGTGTEGYHLAIDIMAPVGSAVRASADGIVAYSANKVHGFGNMIMLVHPEGWITLYAHNSANHVRAGQRVRRGMLIAEVGNTGISRGPHLHFELMHQGKNCDPSPLFRSVPPASGLRSHAAARWFIEGPRPSGVRCAPRKRHPHSYRSAKAS